MAKCRRCGREAGYRVSYAKLWLCGEHFKEYVEERVVETVVRHGMTGGGGRVVVAVSGGVDSMSLLAITAKRRVEMGVEKIVGVHVNLGIEGYSDLAEAAVREYCGSLGVECTVLRLRDILGVGLPELASRAGRPPCSVCGLVKRYLITAYAVATGASAVFTGHHLDDAARYMLKDLYVGDFKSLAGLKPAVREPGLPVKAKPLITLGKKDIEAYAELAGVPHLEAPCPFKHSTGVEEAAEGFLKALEREHPGARLILLSSMLKLIEGYLEPVERETYRRCSVCGMPSRSSVCSFCRLTERTLGEPMGGRVLRSLSQPVYS